MARYFPVALRLEGRRCVVVGGGRVAARRVEALLDSGGNVTVVAPKIDPSIGALASESRIDLYQAPYQASHLEGAFLVVAATDRPDVNAQVAADAQARSILCNDAEMAERGDLIVPSVVRRGDLLLTVTTLGSSPSLAARIKDDLESRYGPEYAEYVAILGAVRERAMQIIADPQARRTALNAAAEDSSILSMIREGRVEEARRKALSCISSPSD